MEQTSLRILSGGTFVAVSLTAFWLDPILGVLFAGMTASYFLMVVAVSRSALRTFALSLAAMFVFVGAGVFWILSPISPYVAAVPLVLCVGAGVTWARRFFPRSRGQ